MYCIWCGEEVDETSSWCPYCGKQLDEVENDKLVDSDVDGMTKEGETETAPIDSMANWAIGSKGTAKNGPVDFSGASGAVPLRPIGSERVSNGPSAGGGIQGNKKPSSKALIAVVAIMAIAAIVVCAVLVVMPRLGSSGSRSDDPQASSTPHEHPAAEEQADDEQDADGDADVGVSVHSSLGEYSWEELSTIADEIEECSSRTDAIAVAARYNLVGADGTMYAQTIDLVMADGTTVKMRIVDVYHDEMPDGSRAGLTFMATSIAYQHRMASGRTTDGGWESSEVRQWLATTVWDALPTEVADAIVPVRKLSNNTGKTTTTSSVTPTTDYLWVPSIVELCGPINWTFDSDPANSDFYCSVFNAEGSQYAAYAQAGIRTEDPNSILALGQAWWMRSTAASSGRGRYVGGDGNPSEFGNSSDSHGIVFGFCL